MQNGLAGTTLQSLHVMPAGVYASQSRDDFSADDVEHYFNYMGMLATEVGPMLILMFLAWNNSCHYQGEIQYRTARSGIKRGARKLCPMCRGHMTV